MSGWIAYLVAGKPERGWLWVVILFILLTNLPDFDFLPGLVAGDPNLFHRGASHSLFMALLVGGIVGTLARASGRGRFVPAAVTGWALYTLHIVLDLFSVDYSIPRGFQLLWPWSRDYYIAPTGLFLNITRAYTVQGFFPSLFSSHNLRAVVNELVIFMPAVLLLWGLRGRLRGSRIAEPSIQPLAGVGRRPGRKVPALPKES